MQTNTANKSANIQRGFFVVITALAMTFMMAGLTWYLWDDGIFESEQAQIEKLTSAIVPDSSIVFDTKGEKIGEYFNFYHVFFPYEKIPKPMINALLAIEDRKFFEHKGVNWSSMGRALLAVLTSGRLKQGGSTITMQLVKNYLLTREKKVSRKVREIILSYYVEKNLSKERILELYLNTMYMGHGAYGVGAAALTYFSKPIDKLELHEFALLAGLFQAPSAYDPHKNLTAALKRQHIVLDAMGSAGYLQLDEITALKLKPIAIIPWIPLNQTLAPYFLSYIRMAVAETLGDDGETINDRGMRIYTTLDRSLQQLANNALAHAEPLLQATQDSMKQKKTDRIEAAFLATNPLDGAVLAMIGGRSFKQNQFNRAVSAKRSPGSAFKPIVYGLAIEGGMSWNDMVFVSPINVNGYKPKNHDEEDMTETTLIKALARSMNTPAIALAQKYGIDEVIKRAEAMGITSEMPREIGVSIGGFSATLFDMARMYGVIAAEGTLQELWAISKITDRNDLVLYERTSQKSDSPRVFSQDVAALLRSGLQTVLASGTGSSASDLAGFAAGKTGTSDDSRDNWFCGFTSNMVAISWVGTDGHSPLGKSASGASLALPVWSEVVRGAQAGIRPASNWTTPEGLVAVAIDPDYGSPAEGGVVALFKKDKIPKASQATEDMKSIKEHQGVYRGMKVDD